MRDIEVNSNSNFLINYERAVFLIADDASDIREV